MLLFSALALFLLLPPLLLPGSLFTVCALGICFGLVFHSSQGLELLSAIREDVATRSSILHIAGILYLTSSVSVAVRLLVASSYGDCDPSIGRGLPPGRAQVGGFLVWAAVVILAILLAYPVGRPWTVAMATVVVTASLFGRSAISTRMVATGLLPGLLGVGAVTCAGIVISPVALPHLLTPLPLLLVAVGFWQLLATTLLSVWPLRRGWRPLYWVPLLLFMLTASRRSGLPLEVVTRDTPVVPQDDAPPSSAFQAYYTSWLAKRCDPKRKEPCPLIVVTAAGGGIRAAYWAAAVLEEMDRATHGLFRRHLFAISGVSGGSIGAAAYVAAGRTCIDDDDATPAVPCGAVRQFLRDDLLSPVLSRFLLPDLLQQFIPFQLFGTDRGQVFEQSLEVAWRAHAGTDAFAKSFRDLWPLDKLHDGDAEPLLFLNAAVVENGKRFVIAPLSLDREDIRDTYFAFDPEALHHVTDMALSTAVSLSARFPYITPPAVLLGDPTERAASTWPILADVDRPKRVAWGRLVDGGYFENSGAATAGDIVSAIDRYDWSTRANGAGGRRVQIIVLSISNDPTRGIPNTVSVGQGTHKRWLRSPPPRPLEPAGYELLRWAAARDGIDVLNSTDIWSTGMSFREVATPVQTLLATRDARADAEITALERQLIQVHSRMFVDCVAQRCGGRDAHTVSICQLVQSGMGFPGCRWGEAFEEVSLGKELQDFLTDKAVKTPGHIEVPALRDSGLSLGWLLSSSSAALMDRFAAKAHRVRLTRRYGELVHSNLVLERLADYENSDAPNTGPP